MLSVGREIGIAAKEVACRACGWEGIGSQLASGLIKVDRAGIYLYVYRCAECGRFDVVRKAKILKFRSADSLNALGETAAPAEIAPARTR